MQNVTTNDLYVLSPQEQKQLLAWCNDYLGNERFKRQTRRKKAIARMRTELEQDEVIYENI